MASQTFDEIRVLEVRETRVPELPDVQTTETERTVSEKVEEYLVQAQCGTSHTQGILLQLMTIGKVRVDFRDYSERLQLVEAEHRMERQEAIQKLEEAFEKVLGRGASPKDPDLTQKIIIQPPKGGGYFGSR